MPGPRSERAAFDLRAAWARSQASSLPTPGRSRSIMNFRMAGLLGAGRATGSFDRTAGCGQMADATWLGGDCARTGAPMLLDVTVLFLEGGHASTAAGPLEVFRDA